MKDTEKLENVPESTKLARKLEVEYVSEVRGMSTKDLENKLLELAKEEQEIITTRKNDETLEKAIENKKMLDEPYVEQLKMNKLRKRFVALVLKENS